jgi:hypothetical protein
MNNKYQRPIQDDVSEISHYSKLIFIYIFFSFTFFFSQKKLKLILN